MKSARMLLLAGLLLVACAPGAALGDAAADADAALKGIGTRKGICVVLGKSGDDAAPFVKALAEKSELMLYVQMSEAGDVRRLQESLEQAGLLAKRVYVAKGAPARIHLAGNLADAVLVSAGTDVSRAELLRVLRPGGKAVVGEKTIIKPALENTDEWSHPYHDPSNNPQSTDRIARAPYLTQFLARPVFGCQPCVTVAGGGRIFRAFGHMAFKSYQNEVLQHLYATNAYNGTLLWKRKLTPGFMIHRNTIIATPDTLYLADDRSCKVIDAATGEVTAEIIPPKDVAGGTVWKWMALVSGRLYALMGGEEVKATRRPGRNPNFGGWPWGMWRGYDYKGRERAWGFGLTFLAMDPKTGKVLWSHREKELVDSRAVCMSGSRIYFYSPGTHLGCLDAGDGKVLWRNSDTALIEAIGRDDPAQNPGKGFTTSAYLKCSDRYLFFAGPQRRRLVAVYATDGKLAWQYEKDGNYQLVLREDALYAAGHGSLKFDYDTGKVLGRFRGRRACTRATGSIDSIFYRAPSGTTRYIPATNREQHVAPMRPPCQDGVVIADGLLHWGPWICGCKLSLFGHICLGPAGGFDFAQKADESRQLELADGDITKVKALAKGPGDWPAFRHDVRRSTVAATSLPQATALKWTWKPPSATVATAPVTAGGLVFVADTQGVVRALDAERGTSVWKTYTEGAIYYPPAIREGRACVGSNDGRVYAFEAATGRLLWRFRVAPVDRRVPLYGTIASTWPVAGGVVVEDGVVYAAAGIAHFDGTHVCALDAVTGKIRWHNNSSGNFHPALANGVGLMGNVRLVDGRIEFPGGNAYPTASYDVKTGKCLNKPQGPWSGARNLFHPRDAWKLQHSLLVKVALHPPAGTVQLERTRVTFTPTEASRKAGFRKWQAGVSGTCSALACAGDAVLVAYTGQKDPRLTALRMKDGEVLWSHKLPAPAVVWGIAVDGAGRVFISLEDGRVLCFGRPGGEDRALDVHRLGGPQS